MIMKKQLKVKNWEKEFDKKFVPKYPNSGFEPIDGLTANVFTIKQFIKDNFNPINKQKNNYEIH